MTFETEIEVFVIFWSDTVSDTTEINIRTPKKIFLVSYNKIMETAVITILAKLLVIFFNNLPECFRFSEETLRFPGNKSIPTGWDIEMVNWEL